MSTPARRQVKSIAAEAAFRARIVGLRGQVLGAYVNGQTPVECVCPEGHSCWPRPADVQRRGTMCRACAGLDPVTAEAKFRARIAERGGQVIGEYRGMSTPVDCLCAEGHPCSPSPSNIQKPGRGMCRICAGQDPDAAEAAFHARVVALDGRAIGEYVNAQTPVECTCAAGHTCWPTPDHLQSRGSFCPTCSGRDPVATEAAFRAHVHERGGRVVARYVNSQIPVECLCKEGHVCWPTASRLRDGQGMCRTCAGLDPAIAESAFYARMGARGGRVIGDYVNALTPVECVCAEGHTCWPTPGGVQQGMGICRVCAHRAWDVFYVVTSSTLGRVKLGITSGDPRGRLASHRRASYTDVVRVLPDLPDARALETHVVNTLRDAGIPAAHGREYFDVSVLALVLDVADGWTTMVA